VLIFMVIDKRTLPEIEYSDGMAAIDWNSGVTVDENDRRTEKIVSGIKGIETATAMTGTQDFMLPHTPDITPSEALVYMKCQSPKALTAAADSLKGQIQSIWPEATVECKPAGNLLNMIFSSDEPDLLIMLRDGEGKRPSAAAAKAFTDTLRRQFKTVAVPEVVTEENLTLVADVEKMSFYKVTYARLAQRLKELAGRNDVLRINRGAANVPVMLGEGNDDREMIMRSTVTADDGNEIPLNYIITERLTDDYKHLYGNDGGEYYPVAINAETGDIKDIISFVKEYDRRHNAVSTDFSGAYFSGRQTVSQLTGILIVSLLLLFFILAAQFESLIQPAIILSEMVIDMFLVLLGLWLCGETLNVMSMIGIIVMGGIVINDSILKIDTINRLRRGGMPLIRAIVTAGKERLLPIIMTSLTTICAMLPFMTRGSIGADMQYPLSLAIIIGMAAGTMVSLFFVPVIYYLIYRRKDRR